MSPDQVMLMLSHHNDVCMNNHKSSWMLLLHRWSQWWCLCQTSESVAVVGRGSSSCPAVSGRVFKARKEGRSSARWHLCEEAPRLPAPNPATHIRRWYHNTFHIVPLYLISKVQFTQKIRGVWDHILLSFLIPRLTQWPRQSHRGMDFQ